MKSRNSKEVVRSREYDATFARQISLTERVDSLYNNIALLNSVLQVKDSISLVM